MNCEKVLGRLSLFLDDMLEDEQSALMLRHLGGCPDCSRELARLKSLHNELRNMDMVAAPECLRALVYRRIRRASSETWHENLRSELEYAWSRLKTTEMQWYAFRLTGVLATVIFFIAISTAMNPIYMKLSDQLAARGDTQAAHTLAKNLQMVFGSPLEAQKRPIPSSEPKINDEYLANFAQNASRTAQDDTVSVVTMVDRNGAARVQDILEYPADDSLLSDLTEMINSASWRPASHNGHAVSSPLVMTFTKIYVYN